MQFLTEENQPFKISETDDDSEINNKTDFQEIRTKEITYMDDFERFVLPR